MRHKVKGQVSLELAALIVLVILALIFAIPYVQRAKMGNLKASADQLGDQFSAKHSTSTITQESGGTRNEVRDATGKVISNITAPETQTRTGEEHVTANLDQEKAF